jgi:hypothetical protein
MMFGLIYIRGYQNVDIENTGATRFPTYGNNRL